MGLTECPVCAKPNVGVTAAGKIYKHDAYGELCDASGTRVKAEMPPEAPPVRNSSPQPDRTTSRFLQPGKPGKAEARPMTGKALEIAARFKETFYAYDNRRADDNRSAQTHLGPSEIGTPCDRRLAMFLMQIPPVNPGGDGWAAFVGTCIHAGLAEVFLWANGGSGRYAVELPLEFPNEHVPRGTGDLLDRTMCLFVDFKAMGRWSLEKLRTTGPGPRYRVQVHCYGYAARIRGEAVEYVAIIGLPREGSSLDDLYVWCEPYDPTVARDALARVDEIAEEVKRCTDLTPDRPDVVAARFPIADDCRFCPYHMPGAKDLSNGSCNGRT